ncbi:unnamed protein product [Urochloa decumbens]|uniref:Uncharacterized protein n=1 Tax=Urochloa decumbens TaxID=240449 RepID=A0ABC8XTI3_9POAL
MEMTPACCVDEEELTLMKSLLEEGNDDDDREIEEMMTHCLSQAAELQDVDVLSSEALAWATGMEVAGARMAESMGSLAEDIRRGVAVLAQRPGEEAAAEALLRHAALADAHRADGEELVAATRRLQEKGLRRLAAAEHLVDPGCLVVVRFVVEVLGSDLADGCVPTPEEVDAAAVLERQVVAMRESMVALAGRLRRGAAAFEARPGEEALVDALRRQAANADAVRATAEARTPCTGTRTQVLARNRRWQGAGNEECQDMII